MPGRKTYGMWTVERRRPTKEGMNRYFEERGKRAKKGGEGRVRKVERKQGQVGAAMAGAMGAAMLLAGVFIAAGALAILAMQLLWR